MFLFEVDKGVQLLRECSARPVLAARDRLKYPYSSAWLVLFRGRGSDRGWVLAYRGDFNNWTMGYLIENSRF